MVTVKDQGVSSEFLLVRQSQPLWIVRQYIFLFAYPIFGRRRLAYISSITISVTKCNFFSPF